jgi:hypothetical protein
MTNFNDVVTTRGRDTVADIIRSWFLKQEAEGLVKFGKKHSRCRMGDNNYKTNYDGFYGWNICNECMNKAVGINNTRNILDILNDES